MAKLWQKLKKSLVPTCIKNPLFRLNDSGYPKIGFRVSVPPLLLRSLLGFPRAKKKRSELRMILPSNPPKMFGLSKQSAQELHGVHISQHLQYRVSSPCIFTKIFKIFTAKLRILPSLLPVIYLTALTRIMTF